MKQLRKPQIPSAAVSIRQEAVVGLERARGKQPHFGDILPGRPCPGADLPIPTDRREIEELYREYYEILEELHYGEGMALMRALGYKKSTWLMRKYKRRKPQLPEVVLTVNWFRGGKPIISHKRRLTAELLFGWPPI